MSLESMMVSENVTKLATEVINFIGNRGKEYTNGEMCDALALAFAMFIMTANQRHEMTKGEHIFLMKREKDHHIAFIEKLYNSRDKLIPFLQSYDLT